MTRSVLFILMFFYLLLCSCNQDTIEIHNSEVVVKGFTIPWAIEVIGEHEYLVSERLGDLYLVQNGKRTALSNIPPTRTVSDDYLTYGGLMDVSLHPRFEQNRLVYIAYVGMDNKMNVARFELQGNDVHNLEVIFRSDAFSIGSRIAWQDPEHFFVSQGSGGNPYPEPGGQNLHSDVGKIHRLLMDGQTPADNPIWEGHTEPSSIWSYGHRDPQGLYFDTESDLLLSTEHGPLGGDELNIIVKGANYGWPIFSHGLNYNETPVSDMTEQEADSLTVLPIKVWTPSIAPSSLTLLQSSSFDEFNGSFLIGSLSQQCIVRYNIQHGKSEKLWEGIGRVRDIAELPSGDLLVLIDKGSPDRRSNGRVLRLRRN